MPGKKLTDKKIKKIHDAAIGASDSDEAWQTLTPLIEAQASSNAARALIGVVRNGPLTVEKSLELLTIIFTEHQNNDDMVILLASTMEAGRNIDYLNDPPPTHALFPKIIERLSDLNSAAYDETKELSIIEGLSSTARLMARQYDELAEKSYARLVELLPNASWAHYNQGLFFKTRGRFAEGIKANQRAIELADDPSDSQLWNLGICATGSGQSEVALNTWKKIGQKIEMGRFALPEGRYPSCKVRLAQRPLAERDADHDDPGLEETVWIERLSPCHGIIQSVLYQDLGVDYGDVILFDGAPVTYHKYGERQVPVFPHLATLRKNNYQFFDFAGTQGSEGELGDISEHLEKDAVIYSHSEQFSILCAGCWQDATIDHEHKTREKKHIVTGRIAVPPAVDPKDIVAKIDACLKDTPETRMFSPDLCRAAGLQDRARIEERRFNLLINSVE